MTKVWAHLHLPKWKAFTEGRGDSGVISLKFPGQRVSYTNMISLQDVTFFVSERGRERTLRTGHRNVHAWVIGEPFYIAPQTMKHWKKAVYDPWKGPFFVDKETLEPVHSAKYAYLIEKHVYYREY